jgi:hypothetical protein
VYPIGKAVFYLNSTIRIVKDKASVDGRKADFKAFDGNLWRQTKDDSTSLVQVLENSLWGGVNGRKITCVYIYEK